MPGAAGGGLDAMALARRCRAVLFDLDDTLVPTSRIDRAAILNAATLALASTEAAAQACAQKFAQLLKEKPFPPETSGHNVTSWRQLLWERALRGGGEDHAEPSVSSAAQLAHDTWCSERLTNFRFSDDIVAMVQRLQTAGYKTGLLTNGHADVQRAKTAACDAGKLFGDACVIVAGEYPEQKPHPSIFRVACAALGEPESATVMVGDSYAADIAGGINSNLLATVWIRPEPKDGDLSSGGSLMHGHLAAVPSGELAPTFTVETVLQVEACLEKLG